MAELEDEISSLCSEIHEFKMGTFEKFYDAMEGEMEGCCVNIVFFGMAGSGKSALINSIFQSLGYKEMTPAVTQNTGKEGTKVLDRFFLPGNPIALIDTRGYFSMDTKEEGRSFFTHEFQCSRYRKGLEDLPIPVFERSGLKRIYLYVNISIKKKHWESVTNVSGEKVTSSRTTAAWFLAKMFWLTFKSLSYLPKYSIPLI